MRHLLTMAIAGAAIVGSVLAFGAANAEPIDDARDAALRIGRVLGAGSECTFIPAPRQRAASAKVKELLTAFAADHPELPDLSESYDKGFAEGRTTVVSKQTNCAFVENDLAALEHRQPPWIPPVPKIAAAPPPPAPVPPPATPPQVVETIAPPPPVVPAPPAEPALPAVHGVDDREIRFGMAAPFSGASKTYGVELKIGTLLSFSLANESGGVNGRKLVLAIADDAYDPAQTENAMNELYSKDEVFGFVGNFGSETTAVALPFALARRVLFFAPFTGANLTRRSPPDRYVFNFRPSYAEETAAVVRYLVKTRRLRGDQIAVFTQQDGVGDAGFDGVVKALRTIVPANESNTIVRLNYPRNTVEVDAAVAQLQQYQKQHAANPIKAVVMVATYRPAAKFIEKTREAFPGLLYTNVSAVGSSALAEELMVLGPKFATGVIVTQAVPPLDGSADVVLEYKAALGKYFPGELPDYVSLEAYLQANILVEALRRTGRQVDPDRLVTALEGMHDLELGVGTKIGFSRAEHQALHKIWGTQLDANGHFQPLDLE